METVYDIFISYSDKDRELAQKVQFHLESVNLKCWISFKNISQGEIWAGAIIQAIKSSKIFLLILTQNSNTSIHVKREIEIADKNGLKLMCFKAENFGNSDEIEYFISSIQQFDGHSKNIEDCMMPLIKAVKQSLGIVEDSIFEQIEDAIKNTINESIKDGEKFYTVGERYYNQANYIKAIHFFEESAANKNINAMCALGLIYFLGKGGLLDRNLAREWFLKAAKNGNDTAKEILKNNFGITNFEEPI